MTVTNYWQIGKLIIDLRCDKITKRKKKNGMDDNQENNNYTPNLEELIDSGLGKINPEKKKEELSELEKEINNQNIEADD